MENASTRELERVSALGITTVKAIFDRESGKVKIVNYYKGNRQVFPKEINTDRVLEEVFLLVKALGLDPKTVYTVDVDYLGRPRKEKRVRVVVSYSEGSGRIRIRRHEGLPF